jgi:hypothetical protein
MRGDKVSTYLEQACTDSRIGSHFCGFSFFPIWLKQRHLKGRSEFKQKRIMCHRRVGVLFDGTPSRGKGLIKFVGKISQDFKTVVLWPDRPNVTAPQFSTRHRITALYLIIPKA